MQRRDDGHPVAALLLLCSMFAFAFVFHAVTRPTSAVPAHFDTQFAAFANPIAADVPALAESRPRTPAATTAALPVMTAAGAATPAPIIGAIETAPALEVFSWSTVPTPLPAAITPSQPLQSPQESGAISRAFATTGSALRNAFKKTF